MNTAKQNKFNYVIDNKSLVIMLSFLDMKKGLLQKDASSGKDVQEDYIQCINDIDELLNHALDMEFTLNLT